ncbi:MAG: hypothetical protein KA603_06765 [Azonexus sp.]|nr:hypothetical protein [Azonexus sp.]MBP6905461.1 hypothetical protein [Azonexus sp.]
MIVFPDGTAQRNYLTREMAARTVFVCLYAGAIEGNDCWIRPNQVCRMTDAQAARTDTASRETWCRDSARGGFTPPVGTPWFADTTREPIRDETIGEGFLPVRAMIERPGIATTSSKGRYALEASFSALFSPALSSEEFASAAATWRASHLNKAALARQALVARGALVGQGQVTVRFPNGETRTLASGPSSAIAKAVIEEFAPRFLRQAHVLWLSESGNKLVARDEQLAATLGIRIDVSRALPDLILVDLGDDAEGQGFLVVFVEFVASDGPINALRRDALTVIATDAGFASESLAFLTAFSDRSSPQFKKSMAEIAWGSFVWLVSEPAHLIHLRAEGQVLLSQLS